LNSTPYDSALLYRPTTVGELASWIKQTALAGKAIYPVGGSTRVDLGHSPIKSGLGVDLRGLNQIIDYPARDMTITVQAGITLEALQAKLSTENQWLPIDVPLPHHATLGGSIATNSSGSRRFGQGTFRDYIIGISAINSDGEEFKAGGRVVKNVAGYDLMKLLTGSLGTLGIITQVTLKVKPRPAKSLIVVIPVQNTSDLEMIGTAIRTTRTRPICFDLINQNAAKDLIELSSDWAFLVGYEDSIQAVEWQISHLPTELPVEIRNTIKVADTTDATTIFAKLRNYPLLPNTGITLKLNLLTSESIATSQWLAQQVPEIAIKALVGNGIISAHLPADAAEKILGILTRLQGAQGNLVVERAPEAIKATLPIWGRSTPDRELMKKIKLAFDPKNIFNPGRFVDGI
jgi:glycolate oxidase FAD binding subunit